MAEAGTNVQSWFSWEEHFLDFLLVFWISCGLLIVTVVNSLTTFFGPLQPRISWDRTKPEGPNASTHAQGPTHPESTFWLNSALNWFYLHYNKFPEFVDAWVVALNEQANKLGGPVQIKFEKVQSGSLPPKFADVTYDAGPEDKYVLTCRVDSRDLSFAVFASQQTHDGVKLTNLKITVLKLRGQLRIRCSCKGNDMMAEIGFLGRPDIKLEGKPVNPYMDPSDLVDVGVVEEVVRNTLCLASISFNVSKWIQGRDVLEPIPVQRTHSVERQRSSESQPFAGAAATSPRSTVAPVQQPEVFEASKVHQQHAFQVPTLATPAKISVQRPQQPSRGDQDKRLLVKVIKASGLKQNEGIIDPCCVIILDQPPQSEVTNVVKNTYNPFWDEQFFFDVTGESQEIQFEIIDKHRLQNDNFLGKATVYINDLLKNPSSRQIIPLQGKLGAAEFVSGSVTVEFLCTDLDEDMFVKMPRRTIETSKSVNSSGMVVTTTATQRPHSSQYDTSNDGSPNYIEKQTFDYSGSEVSLGTGTSEVIHINGVESVAETAIRALSERSKLGKKTPTKTSTLIITGVKRTTESSPTDNNQGQVNIQNSNTLPALVPSQSPEITYPEQVKEKKSLAARIKKRFSRSKKRSLSADRASSSLHEGSGYLQPPGPQSKDVCASDSHLSSKTCDKSKSESHQDDIDLHRAKHSADVPNLKKSRSLGGSLKKLFRRSRKRSRSAGRGEHSRESSLSRHSKQTSQQPSREGSLTRTSNVSSRQDTVIL